jgi:hypothetical protein
MRLTSEDLELPVPPMIPIVSPDFMERSISESTGFADVLL